VRVAAFLLMQASRAAAATLTMQERAEIRSRTGCRLADKALA
jgi:hypothetical protein